MICRLLKVRIWAGSIFVIMFLLANTCVAFTDNSLVPQWKKQVFSFDFTTTDKATCVAVNPLYDRFTIEAIQSFTAYYTDLLFSAVTSTANLSTTTDFSVIQYQVYCSTSSHTNNFDATWYFADSGYISGYNASFPTLPYSEVVGGNTTTTVISTSTQSIDNPTQDYFYGIVLFMGTAVFIIWVFRRRNV